MTYCDDVVIIICQKLCSRNNTGKLSSFPISGQVPQLPLLPDDRRLVTGNGVRLYYSRVDLRLSVERNHRDLLIHLPFSTNSRSYASRSTMLYVSSSSTSVRCPSREDRKSEVRQTRGKLHRLRNTVQPPVVTECDYCSGTSLRNHPSTAYQLVHIALCLCHRT
jgi:hypothetical protein